MKSFLTVSLFIFAFFFAQSTQEVAVTTNVRVPASVNVDCLEAAKNLIADSKPRLSLPKNSLFAKYPVLQEELEKIEFIPFQLNEFVQSYTKRNGRSPTLREAMEAMYSERRDLIGRYDEVIADVEALQDPALHDFIVELKFSRDKLNKFKELDHYDDELISAFNDGKSKFSSIDVPVTMKNNVIETKFQTYLKERSREGNFNGELGELTAYGASKDRPLRKGLKFETRQLSNPIPYQLVIDGAIKKLEADLAKKSDQQIIKLVNTYGGGILRNAKAYLDNLGERPLDRDILIGKIITMIRTKEIDLVFQKADGKIVWAEVKTYKKPITIETLKGDGYKAKPMADQLLEHKALRDLLGFKEQVDLRFISPTSTITPEAKTFIESLGYEVIGAK